MLSIRTCFLFVLTPSLGISLFQIYYIALWFELHCISKECITVDKDLYTSLCIINKLLSEGESEGRRENRYSGKIPVCNWNDKNKWSIFGKEDRGCSGEREAQMAVVLDGES